MSIEKINQTLETVFDHISKHIETRWSYMFDIITYATTWISSFFLLQFQFRWAFFFFQVCLC